MAPRSPPGRDAPGKGGKSAGKPRGKPRDEDDEEAAARPFDPTSEQVVLAAALRDASALDDLLSRVLPDDCYGDRHRIIWTVLRALRAERLEYDGPTFSRVAAGLDFASREWGGEPYLRDLEAAYPDDANLEWHLRQMRAEARLRSAADGPGEDLIAEMRRPGADASRVQALARELLSKAGTAAASSAGTAMAVSGEPAAERYRERFRARLSGKIDNIPVGIKELDAELTWGWWPGHVTVLTGRPSNGKSSVAYNFAKWWVDRHVRGAAEDPRPALFAPLEMGTDAAQDALVARAARVDVTKLVKEPGKLTLEEQMRVAAALDDYVGSPWLEWFDEPSASIDRMEEVLLSASEPDPAREGKRRTRYGVVFWDLFDNSMPDLRPETITGCLKRAQAMARDLSTHLVLLAQIKRGVEKRGDKRPTREDLKGSGGWEEVADQIIGVHRERVYDPDMEEDTIELGTLKQRLGPFGTWLMYDYDAPRFSIMGFKESSRE